MDSRRLSLSFRFRAPVPVGALLVVTAVAAALAPPARADEGMWTYDQPPRAAIREKYGVDLTPAWLEHVRLSSVRIPGCSASFASPDGLVLTNHHCVRSCVEQLSSAERNLLATGFTAATREAEERCPTGQATILMGTEEITSAVLAAAKGLAADAANVARKAEMTRLEGLCAEASRQAPGGELQCEAKDLYQGGQYWLYKYKRHKDVRLVFAPDGGAAHFGGDPDNFDFPRYAFDMALLRVYGADGKPLATPHWLAWSQTGARDGEPVFVSGNPGSTQRLLTSSQLEARRDHDITFRMAHLAEIRGRLLEFSKRSPEAARTARATLLSVENNVKRTRGMLAALLDRKGMAEKAFADAELRARAGSNGGADAWTAIDDAMLAYRRQYRRYVLSEGKLGFAGSLMTHAWALVRAAAERPKPSPERLREFADSALPAMEQRLLAKAPIHADLERMQLEFSLEKLREHLGPDDPLVQLALAKESPAGLAERLVSTTKIADPEVRKALWTGGAEAIAQSADPLLQYVAKIDREARQIRKRWEDEVEAVEKKEGEAIARARFAAFGTSVYPDATSTLRLSYGAVGGWKKNDAMVPAFTVTRGLYDRATGHEPFELGERWVKAQSKLDPTTPFNFVANTDIIGGNSGSPLVNAKGELVGLAFDGNLHSLAGAYWFDGDVNRTVAVDVRIMREALAKVFGAEHLVAEIAGANRAKRAKP